MEGDEEIRKELNRIWNNLLKDTKMDSDHEFGMAFQLYLDTGLLDSSFDDRLAAICFVLKDCGLTLRDLALSSRTEDISNELKKARSTGKYSDYAISFLETNILSIFSRAVPSKPVKSKIVPPSTSSRKKTEDSEPWDIRFDYRKEITVRGDMIGCFDGVVYSIDGDHLVANSVTTGRSENVLCIKAVKKVRLVGRYLYMLNGRNLILRDVIDLGDSTFVSTSADDFEVDLLGRIVYSSSGRFYAHDCKTRSIPNKGGNYTSLVQAGNEVLLKSDMNRLKRMDGTIVRTPSNDYITLRPGEKAHIHGDEFYLLRNSNIVRISLSSGLRQSNDIRVDTLGFVGNVPVAVIVKSDSSRSITTLGRNLGGKKVLFEPRATSHIIISEDYIAVQTGTSVCVMHVVI